MKLFSRLFSLIFVFALITVATPLFAQYNSLNVPDSSKIRTDIKQIWFPLSLSEIREKRAEIRKNSSGQNFQIRMEESSVYYSLIIAPETYLSVDFYTEAGITTNTVSQFPSDAPGTWILMRDSRTEKPVYIRFYFAADSDIYVQFEPAPDGKKTLADFVIDGCYASRGVPVGVSFDYFYTASFYDVQRLTEKSLPWRYADIHPAQYSGTLRMISGIRKSLPRIRYEEDACYDEDGKPVRISDGKPRKIPGLDETENKISLSDAGFAKWVIDSLIEVQTGSSTYLNPLLRPTTSANPTGYAGNKSQSENLSFALDWTRNLAAARLSIQTRKNYLYEDSNVDVEIEPFSSEIGPNGFNSVAGYIKNTGYEVKTLKPLLYVLSSSEPSYFYLAAVRRRVPPVNGNPEYYVFDKTAVIFPYFDNNKKFSCTVFEGSEELTLAQFVKKYQNCYVNLSRVLSSDRFVLR